MKVLISGTAGSGGWPSPDCGCASCARVAPGRRATSVILDVSVAADGRPPLGDLAAPGTSMASDSPAAPGGSATPDAPRTPTRPMPLSDPVRLPFSGPLSGPLPAGYRASPGPDGLTVTTPGGRRVLYAASSPSSPPPYGESSRGGSPYGERGEPTLDLVLLDVLDRPERLGDLRRRGLVGERTHVVAVDVDHRVPTEAELARRAALWGVRVVPDGTVVDTGEPPPAPAPPPRRTLLLGGSRSGKSAEAELRLAAEPEVLYVATGPSGDGDPEWLRRVREHRDRRPAHWDTAETTGLSEVLRSAGTPLLIDGLGTWVAAVFDECDAWPGEAGGGASAMEAVAARCDDLVAAWRQTRSRVVAVSDEVGLGLVPDTAGGRMFRDTLGRLNQRLALESEDVTLVVSGRLLPLL